MSVDTQEILDLVREGMIPAEVYSDPEIFDLESERVFGRAWCFLAHESEILDPGDYVVRSIGTDSFIVIRDENSVVQVLFNMCLHRGVQLCRAERGNASHFRCPYHAWTYKNSGEVIGMPFHRQAYGGDAGMPKDGKRLVAVPRSDTYRGMIFASLDPEAPDLADYLGDFRFFLDMYLRGDGGVVFHAPQRWRVPANWKISSENFAGDSYHTAYTHASIIDVGLFGPSKHKRRKLATTYVAGHGSGTTHRFEDDIVGFDTRLQHIGYPLDMVRRLRENFSAEQIALIEETGVMPSAAGVLPNLAVIHTFVRIEADGPDVPFTSIRLWHPVGPTETEVLSWFVVDRDAPAGFRDASNRAYSMCFGPSGMFEQDDVENWVAITRASRGRLARTLTLSSRLGLSVDGDVLAQHNTDWRGPGEAWLGFGEFGQRALLTSWAKMLATPLARPARRQATIGAPAIEHRIEPPVRSAS